jgi:hypothetical protein
MHHIPATPVGVIIIRIVTVQPAAFVIKKNIMNEETQQMNDVMTAIGSLIVSVNS